MESIKYFPGIMSDIKLVSEEYTSKFVTGPVIKEITSSDGSVSVFTDGPNVDLMVNSLSHIYDVADGVGIDGAILLDGNNCAILLDGNNCAISCDETLQLYAGNDMVGMHTMEADLGNEGFIVKPYGSNKKLFGVSQNSVFINGPLYSNSVFINGPIYLIDDKDHGTGFIEGDYYPMGACIDIKTESTFTGTSASIEVAAEAGAFITLKINDRECQLLEDDLRKLREILDAHS